MAIFSSLYSSTSTSNAAKRLPVISIQSVGVRHLTEAPLTEAPLTEAPLTEAPLTEAPLTEAPLTEAPLTEAPLITGNNAQPSQSRQVFTVTNIDGISVSIYSN